MVHLWILGAVFIAAIQKESAHRTGLLWFFLMCHQSNEYIFAFKFCRQFTYKWVSHRGNIFVDTKSTIRFSCLDFVRIPQYNNVLNILNNKINSILKILCFGKGGLASCASLFIWKSKPIREKYPNHPNTHKLDNLMLVAEVEKEIWINIGLSKVYTFSHDDFKGADFYSARQCSY